MANKTVKCRYNNCRHESKDIPKEEAVKDGRSYFHPDCLKERKEKQEIVNLFLEKINPNTPVPQIRKAVNTIVHTKGFSSEYLLFGLRYYISHKIKLNYPGGLYYVVANKDVESEYNRLKNAANKIEFSLEDDVEDQTFVYHKTKRKSIDNFME